MIITPIFSLVHHTPVEINRGTPLWVQGFRNNIIEAVVFVLVVVGQSIAWHSFGTQAFRIIQIVLAIKSIAHSIKKKWQRSWFNINGVHSQKISPSNLYLHERHLPTT